MDAAGHGRPPLPPVFGGKNSKHSNASANAKSSSKSAKEIPRPGSIDAIVALTAAHGRVESSNDGGMHCPFLDSQVATQKGRCAATIEARATGLGGMVTSSKVQQCSTEALEVEPSSSSEGDSCGGSDDSSSEGESMALEAAPNAANEGIPSSSAMRGIDSCPDSEFMNVDPSLRMSDAANTLRVGASRDASMQDLMEENCCTPSARSNAPSKQKSDFDGSNGVRELGSCELGAAVIGDMNRKWSDIAGFDNPPSREKISVVPIPPSKAVNAFNPFFNTVRLCDESRKNQHERFDSALVGRLFGRRLPYQFLRDELYKRWEKFGSFRMITAGPDCFMCLFDEEHARDRVLIGGPWIVAGQVIGIDKWSRHFSPTSEVGFITPVWVRLPGLPFDCWEMQNLARILEAIGTPLWVDAATAQLDRGSFARACVKINLAKPLSAGLWMEDNEGKVYQPILYEGLSMFCCKCGYVGHKETACPGDIKTAPPSVISNNGIDAAVDVNVSLHQILKAGGSLKQDEVTLPRGDWMIVGRRRRVGGTNEGVRIISAVEKITMAAKNTLLHKKNENSNSFRYLQDCQVQEHYQVKGGGSESIAGRSANSPKTTVRTGVSMKNTPMQEPIEGKSQSAFGFGAGGSEMGAGRSASMQTAAVRAGGSRESSPSRTGNDPMTHGCSVHVDSDTDWGVVRSPRAEPSINSPMKQVHLKAKGKKEENSEKIAFGSTHAMEINTKDKWVPNAATPPFIRNADFYKTPIMNLVTTSSSPPGGKFKKKRARDRFSPSTISRLATDIKNSLYKECSAGSGGEKCNSGTDEKTKGHRKINKSKAGGDSSSLVEG